MTVHFIGAGPGAADLITIRGLRLLQSCPICLYAGSLIPKGLLDDLPPNVKRISSENMSLDEIFAVFKKANDKGQDVARLHSGDPSIYGAIAEQMRYLDEYAIPYDITPGVPSFAAAAAAMKQELTLPGVNQSIILTRTSKNSSAMPERETLAHLGASRATLVIHLSATNPDIIIKELSPLYGDTCPVVIAANISWHNEKTISTTLSKLKISLEEHNISRTAIIFVGPALSLKSFSNSYLYSKNKN
ncbi:precorrin-4 C(11)-methyltransferase [Bartonella sp. HY329]|uniref:precorrin-4 C(11)-methyltransferase n=1 Tax=unclassified Bartonella TaxID=2645622 RepID=UPI0021C82F98|nr:MULTISPECIES: precorrin-4 C(11)-methyltransferase [unclassified Bartonella]UXM93991.1 precorrin-4 C(11)-methyltransferase [Bartonella sp. HY329]UXN08313.1 precorrin-4 C(11)-methyltransferase [Bartonella sp. HY328]